MTRSPAFERLSQRTLEEHQHIHFHLEQLRQTLGQLDAAGDDVEPLRRLAAAVESFKERLQEHFDLEERGGVFQAILDALPDAGPAVHRLGAQHERMIEVLEMARIHAQRGEPCEAGPLKADLARFLDEVQLHERDEEALIRRALGAELRLS